MEEDLVRVLETKILLSVGINDYRVLGNSFKIVYELRHTLYNLFFLPKITSSIT